MDERVQARMRELDERLGEIALPPALERRVLARAAAPRGTPSMLVLVGVAAALVLVFWLGRRTGGAEAPTFASPIASTPVAAPGVEEPSVDPQPGVPVTPGERAPSEPLPPKAPLLALWDGALAAGEGCRVEGDTQLTIAGECRLELSTPALAIDVWGPSILARAEGGVRVVEGELLFAVDKVAPGARRVRVEVAAGAIEVLGTRFAVVQHGDEGHVDLLEGAIEFVERDGTTHAIEPGRRLRWANDAVVPPTKAPARPKPVDASGSDTLDATLVQVAALRRASRWADAIALLHRARRELKDGAAAEILSYEEGTLRAHQDDVPAMCAYWRGHVARFGHGEHAPGAGAQLARVGCDP